MLTKRRRKAIHSCEQCRRRKIRCDRGRPCSHCVTSGAADECHYETGSLGSDILRGSVVQSSAQTVFLADPGTTRGARRRSRTPPPRKLLPLAVAEPPVQVNLVSADGGNKSSPRLQLAWNGSLATDTFVEPITGRLISTPKEVLRGENDGPTTHWGRTHGATSIYEFPDAIKFLLASKEAEVPALYCIAATTRIEQPSLSTVADEADALELRSLLPERELADRLLRTYQENFELNYRVIHFPTLLKGYLQLWEQSERASSPFIATLLGIFAVTSSLISDDGSADTTGLNERSLKWAEAARSWLSKQSEQTRPSISCMQIHCLLLIAHIMTRVGGDNVWVSVGELVRVAIAAGLHRDPVDFPKISPFWAEMRRRIWYTILELDLQLSLDHGRTPIACNDEYDTALPANVNDEGLKMNMEQPPVSQPSSVVTQSSAQVLLAKSWPLRSRACRIAQKIKLDTSYEVLLQIDSDLNTLLRETRRISAGDKSEFRKFVLDDMIYKAVITSHRMFAGRAAYDPRFLYSRQVSLETAINILSRVLVPPSKQGTKDVPKLFADLANICRGDISKSIQALCYELLEQAKHHQKTASWTSPTVARQMSQQQQEMLIDMIERSIVALKAVSTTDEKSLRISSWLQIAVSLSKAVVNGSDPVKAMEGALNSSIRTYSVVMGRSRPPHWPQNRLLSHGEADMVSAPADQELWNGDDQNFQMLFAMDDMQSISEWLLGEYLPG